MKKPAQRAAIAPPGDRRLRAMAWAVAILLATALAMAGLALASSTATDEEMAALTKRASAAESRTLAAEARALAAEADVASLWATVTAPEPPPPPAPHYPSGSELDQYVVKVAIGGGHGSGVVVGDGTYVLTAGHVAADAGETGEVLIVRQDGTAVDGEVLWIALNDDIALIKIEPQLICDANELCFERGWPAAQLACEAPTVGGAIEVVGHPGFGQTLDWAHTKGHVVQIYDNGYGLSAGRRIMFIDANVYLGNSGGPAFDAQGRVIGIISALIGVEVGYGFSSTWIPFGYNIAVPSDVACGMMPL